MNPVKPTPPSEAELHAWVDGQLDPGRTGAVTDWLLQHPADAERVQSWQSQRQGLQAMQRGVLDEPIPLALARAIRPQPRRYGLQGLVAGLLLATGFAGGWWWGPGLSQPADQRAALPGFVQEARVAHAVYVPEKRHPVEVGAQEQAHLVQWLSRRLGTPVKSPDLQAEHFFLMGGRLLPGRDGKPRALFMYEDGGGQRVTLLVSALDAELSTEAGAAFRFAHVGSTETFYWVEGRLGYALSGDLPREQLARLADAVYRQLP